MTTVKNLSKETLPKVDVPIIPVKRKRGRPKKNTTIIKNKKIKKNHKSKSKIYSLLEVNKNITPQKIVESVVVHLPININKFQKNNIFYDNEFFNYDTKIIDPLPYDQNNNNNIYENIKIKNKEMIENKNEYNIHKKNKFIYKKVKEILVQYNDFNKIKQWPNTTEIKCWWCCHNFDNAPCGIPIKYEDDTFYVYGCFCSFNCSLSYNFNSNVDKKWDRAGLIKLLYNKTYNTDKELNYAPNRECLKDFGGYMTIKEFRLKNDINYNINYPPMLSIIPQIEEIKIIKDTNRENNLKEKLNLVSEKMKIKNRIKNKQSLSIFLKSKVDKQ